MKKCHRIYILLSAFLGVAIAVAARQGTTHLLAADNGNSATTITDGDYRPQTSWPYLYPTFLQSSIENEQVAGDSTVYVSIKALYNIHLKNSALQYVDASDGRVHLALISPSQYIMLDGHRYVSRDGKMMEQLYKDETSTQTIELLCLTDGNWQALFRYQGAAYGMDLTTSANADLYNSELAGIDRPLYEVLCQQHADGREILLEKNYYICITPKCEHDNTTTDAQAKNSVATKVEKASRKVLEQPLSKDRRPAFRQFCKDSKIDWHDASSLIKAIKFVTE